MKRITLIIFAALALGAGVAGAGPTVIAQDGGVVDNAVITQAGDHSTWVRVGLGAPLEATVDEEGNLHLPNLEVANYAVLDAVTGDEVTAGSLQWQVPGAPADLASGSWTATDGRLDLPCRGNERVIVSAPGYAPTAEQITADGRRHTLLLQPQGELIVELQPPLEARMWLAREERINVTSFFFSVAEKHHIGADGLLEIKNLDLNTPYVGVVLAQGKVPVQTYSRELPQHLELLLVDGLAVSGLVRDEEGNPLSGARVEALGEIAEIDGFRYTQVGATSDEGSFRLTGLLRAPFGFALVPSAAPAPRSRSRSMRKRFSNLWSSISHRAATSCWWCRTRSAIVSPRRWSISTTAPITPTTRAGSASRG